MRDNLYDEMFVQEKTYWWHVAKRQLIHKAMALDAPPENIRVFDAGCGTGATLEELSRYRTYGGDVSSKSIGYCHQRGLVNVRQINFEKKLPYQNNYFAVITCLDVLEHVENDKKLLEEFYRLLTLGGRLYITVPAYGFFWTYWDEMLGHKRRYRRSELTKTLERRGFRIKRASYFYSFLVPFAFVFRLIKTVTGNRGSDFIKILPVVNQVLLMLCRIERYLVFNLSVPVGLSIFIEAKKI